MVCIFFDPDGTVLFGTEFLDGLLFLALIITSSCYFFLSDYRGAVCFITVNCFV